MILALSLSLSQVGLVDLEINRLTKILFMATVLLGLVLLALKVSNLLVDVIIESSK